MKVHLMNIGCKVNFADLSRLKALLLESNYTIVSNIADADIVLINTCAVTNQSEAQSRQIIRRANAQNPHALVCALGCYAQIAAEDIISTTGAAAVFGQNEKFQIPQLLKELIQSKSKHILVSALDSPAFEPSSSAENEKCSNRNQCSRTRAFLKLQDGCNYKCSYCIVPTSRGASRSIPFELIPPQINKLIASGYNEIVISGINLSDYRGKNGERFVDLLKLLNNIDKYCDVLQDVMQNVTIERNAFRTRFLPSNLNSELHLNTHQKLSREKQPIAIRFRISSIEPQVLDSTVVELLANSKYICPHFHIPLQSGSDSVLTKMHRRYNTTQFRNSIELINQYIPAAFIGLDVISGFPTETEADFNVTKDFISSLQISALHCFTYSAKQSTPAAALPQLPKWLKKQRTKELLAISSKKKQHFLEKNIGNKLNFLPEKYDNINGLTLGYTENYIRVGVNSNAMLPPQFHSIQIKSIYNDLALGELTI